MLLTKAVVGGTGGVAPSFAVGTVYTVPVPVLEKLKNLSAKEPTPCRRGIL
tara:strand:- start:703 stop:855 length:153 start_codon:yes stop_codon:yes gene_type:complete